MQKGAGRSPPLLTTIAAGLCAPSNTLWNAGERVHAAAMGDNLDLLWRDAGASR